MAHITGGGITENLPRVLPEGCAAEIDLDAWTVPPIFRLMQEHGAIARDEMFRAFNMGIGLVIVVRRRDAAARSRCAGRAVRRTPFAARRRRRRRPRRSATCERRQASVRRLGVLISGRGSNLQSIIDAIAPRRLDATIAVVISNRADAAGLERARDAGIEAVHLSPRDYRDRDAYDRALADAAARARRRRWSASPDSCGWSAGRCSTRFRTAS